LNKRIVVSWSGGKDGCMTLHTLIEQGYEVISLVTTVPQELERTFGHGERTEMIRLQGEALGIPVHFIECTFDSYTDKFIEAIQYLKQQYHISAIAYGDLYLDGHRQWGEKVAEAAGVVALYPLWTKEEAALEALRNYVKSGYQAVVIRVRDDVLDESWLGRQIDQSFLRDIQKTASCPMGESGEYHSYVYDGPLFAKKIQLEGEELIQLETTKKLEFKNFRLV
jgi:diphthine-ammonia ligase